MKPDKCSVISSSALELHPADCSSSDLVPKASPMYSGPKMEDGMVFYTAVHKRTHKNTKMGLSELPWGRVRGE